MAPLTDRELDALLEQPDTPAYVAALIRDLREARQDRYVLSQLLADAFARLTLAHLVENGNAH